MDTTGLMQALMNSGNLSALSNQTGASPDQLTSVLQSVLPSMLDGANAQATGQDTAQSFQEAITTHAKDDISDVGSFFGKVDLEDGAKIIAHLLGANTSSATEAASTASGLPSSDVESIMSLVAPLLLSMIGQQDQSSTQNLKKKGLLFLLKKLFS